RVPMAEIALWRGRFTRAGALRIAVVMDLTTRLMPEMHQQQAIDHFDRFVSDVVRKADHVVTISENSRRDIIRHLPVFPEHVRVMPVPVSNAFLRTSHCKKT